MTASINDNVIMGDDSYDAFLKILEGDCNRSVTVDSPPAVELGEVLNPAGGFVSHGLSSLNSNSSHGVSKLLLESQDIESLDSNVSTIPASVGNEVGHACRRSALTLMLFAPFCQLMRMDMSILTIYAQYSQHCVS